MGTPSSCSSTSRREGLARSIVDHLQEQIERLKHEGLTILLAEQGVDFSLALADRALTCWRKGSIRFSGAASDSAQRGASPELPPLKRRARAPLNLARVESSILVDARGRRRDPMANVTTAPRFRTPTRTRCRRRRAVRAGAPAIAPTR